MTAAAAAAAATLTVLAMPSSGNVSNLTSYSRCHLPRKSQYDLLRNAMLTFGLRTFCTLFFVEMRTILVSKSCGGGGECCIVVILIIYYFALPSSIFRLYGVRLLLVGFVADDWLEDYFEICKEVVGLAGISDCHSDEGNDGATKKCA